MADIFCEQIDEAKTQLALLNTAIRFLYANPHKSYTLDTGQGSQTVRREDLSDLQNQRSGLLNEISTLDIRCNGGAAQQIVPGY